MYYGCPRELCFVILKKMTVLMIIITIMLMLIILIKIIKEPNTSVKTRVRQEYNKSSVMSQYKNFV